MIFLRYRRASNVLSILGSPAEYLEYLVEPKWVFKRLLIFAQEVDPYVGGSRIGPILQGIPEFPCLSLLWSPCCWRVCPPKSYVPNTMNITPKTLLFGFLDPWGPILDIYTTPNPKA